MTIDRRIEMTKISTSMRKLIGRKYVQEYLKTKYNTSMDKVCLNERIIEIKQSSIYLAKIANRLNYYGKILKLRGKKTTHCPICMKKEDYIHVMKCWSTKERRIQFLTEVKAVEWKEYGRYYQYWIIYKVQQFFGEQYFNKHLIKIIFEDG